LKDYLSRACPSLHGLQDALADTAASWLDIRYTAVGPDFLCAEMPVDERTRQPHGLLHGGVSMVLAETLGSVASHLLVRDQGGRGAGIEVGGSHVRPATTPIVTGICRPVRIGRNLHFWHIEVRDANGLLCCNARLTVAVKWPRGEPQGD